MTVLKPEEKADIKSLKELKFDDKGLIPAIVQDYKSKEVLMVAYMNEESLKKTLEIKKTCFWSRSRGQFWVKGETSGHLQFVKSIAYDCDKDALLIKVRQVGAACHTGKRSCFYRKLKIK
ncbi:MAG TPA: phosphoribosyl-AMP cyclohydrolase [Candidatus Omnitrophica bacterium]|nr:phosphoribosyl-AMP cyclohydrolase [Candidatus Omnitrophota bacterium]